MEAKNSSDFTKGKVWRSIVAQAVPLTVAQMVQLLYNVVDRIYIGHLPDVGAMALTGIGLAFPLTTLISAFTYLYGNGGAPLFAIARGAQDDQRAERILGQVVTLLTVNAVVLMALCYLFRRPVLYLFGASDASYGYADAYLKIYLLGTPCTMLATGLNGFINALGHPRIGMGTTLLGAALNLVLDPLFIFVFGMGVQGAAIATVISQLASMIWVLLFFAGPRISCRIRRQNLRLRLPLVRDILGLGMSGFIMAATNCLVQVVCNATLRVWGGDLYVGVMTILNSVREILSLPVNGITSGAQPVLSYNFGAQRYSRVREGIRFTALLGAGYTVAAWAAVIAMPHLLVSIFTSDPATLAAGQVALKQYFFGFFFMAFQFVGQSCFTSLRCPKRAVFFSLLRKAVIVAPLTVLLPRLGMGVAGVFWAEPISNAVGGLACFITMWLTLSPRPPAQGGAAFEYRALPRQDKAKTGARRLQKGRRALSCDSIRGRGARRCRTRPRGGGRPGRAGGNSGW